MLSVEFASSVSLKEGRPSQKFKALSATANVSKAANIQSMLTETDDCKSGNYSVITCQRERELRPFLSSSHVVLQKIWDNHPPISSGCGAWSLDLQPVGRTIGGNPAQDGQWPSVAIVRSKINETILCTASVLSQKWVLTAASCLERM